MSEVTKYMKAIAEERKEWSEKEYMYESKLIEYHAYFEDLAERAGINVGDESWWDISPEKQFDILKSRINQLRPNNQEILGMPTNVSNVPNYYPERKYFQTGIADENDL